MSALSVPIYLHKPPHCSDSVRKAEKLLPWCGNLRKGASVGRSKNGARTIHLPDVTHRRESQIQWPIAGPVEVTEPRIRVHFPRVEYISEGLGPHLPIRHNVVSGGSYLSSVPMNLSLISAPSPLFFLTACPFLLPP